MATPVTKPKGAAANRYEQMRTDRTPYEDRARECSKLCIPTMYPMLGAGAATNYPTPWQSMGARCVNNLAAKLLLSLFPPNTPFFALKIDDFTLQKLTQQEGMRADVEEALNSVERAVMTKLESSAARPAIFEALKQLQVGGNALVFITPKCQVRVFKLTNYVVKRDPAGNPLEIIVKECMSALEVPEAVRTQIAKQPNGGADASTEDDVDVYTWLKRTVDGWTIAQYVEDVMVPGSSGSYPKDKCPWLPLRWTALDGEDYGRGIFEEYLGDFRSYEGLQKAIVQGSAAAAKVLFLVKPNATTKKDVISKSESGDVHNGNAEDVTVLQMQKYNDFKIASETINRLKTDLSFAFMLNTAIQRDGERVTAEEIRYMANELEASLGGVYSTMSQSLQLPLVVTLMGMMERNKELPPLPKGVVQPTITTGIEAIGRGNDLTRLSSFMQSIEPLGPTAIAWINIPDLITRTATAHQIDQKGLVKTKEQFAQEQQQQMMAQAGMAAVPHVAKGAMDMAANAQNPQGAPSNG
jgi:hypothetical protein